ncbi:hypothetical protein [Lichenibacterium dinghuense]|uniref:hypothetical protein n=1 Tax=Lichenibacterium dinghuense TaxID=2895977 RepID=UPI001F288951|nr:hypothetical protein [Lichenibacterium sp. 6Y81]
MADENDSEELAAMWTVRLSDVERLLPDDDDDEGLWAVEFELNGPGVNGSLTALVGRSVNEDDIIPRAREMLQDGLRRWLRVLTARSGAEQVKPKPE